MFEKQAKNIILAIGSNLGNRHHNIEKSKYLINTNEKIKIISTSSYYRTDSWPNKKDPYFLNIVLKCITTFNPSELFIFVKKIEKSLGRSKSYKNAPRICDIDVIDYDNRKLDGEIILPHPRMHTRNFVLMPMYELDKDWKHPILKHSIKKLILSLPNKDIRSIKQI